MVKQFSVENQLILTSFRKHGEPWLIIHLFT